MRKIVTLLLCGSMVFLGGCANSNSSGTAALEQQRPSAIEQASVTSITSLSPPSSPAPRANNFAFVFRSRTCSPTDLNILDTASGTLVHTPLGETTTITVPLQLTDSELDAIYQKVIDIDFFSYPAELRIPTDQVRGMQTPASTYQVRVTNGTMANTVTWTDDVTEPKLTEAERFRELIQLIEQTMQSHPEMRQLPEPKAGCA